ncbi:helix-turn-helix domain-containing protein [Streptosporangium sp. NBC_01755]|uniref:helix-turn-helix domain-containing protein n=1 Tax=unclassified Streptosporangium TaxID=2632669 RepID=UPI002DDA1418|nr:MULTISPECIES: helix-turn-helix transcriptional regulator [unclassified Streptosporangium]WSA26180.1 helix-turn-helix domain-containing protein [Streptosporangium sp. NBC_01810]WSD02391.1 helix-turn-helix domain-containing protein [Streptosporangium sp. NBC_01755]
MPEVRATVRRRRLGRELEMLRHARKLTLEDAAILLMRPKTSLSKIENGKQQLRVRDVPFILDKYELDDPARREEIMALASKAAERDWWQKFQGVVRDPFADYLSLEESATLIFKWSPLLIPGWLQTEAYARHVVAASRMWQTKEEIDKFVALRMKRKTTVLDREEPPQVWVVLSEMAVRQHVGAPDMRVMKEQLEHLKDVAADRGRPHVQIVLLPYLAGEHAGLEGAFTWMRFDSGPEVICLEALTSAQYLEDEDEVARYAMAADHLRSAAQPPRDTIATLSKMIKEL